MMRRFLFFVAIVIVLISVAAAVLANNLWRGIHEPYKGYAAAEQFVEIPRGANSAEIARRLADAQIIRDAQLFRVALWWTGQGRSLKAGEYRFDRQLTPIDVADILGKGSVYAHRVTFPEGLTMREMASVFEKAGFGPASAFLAAAKDVSLIKNLDPEAADLEGYLFPDTYALPRESPVMRLIAMMVARFRSAYTEDVRRDAEAAGLTTRQVVTLASLIEKETGAPSERPIVAAVYANRMKLGMPLQADPTVIYALERTGRYDGNIRRDDLSLDSPYNTYRYPGLPPGPIANPGGASLEAAVRPAKAKYLYFVSRNDGTHVFAETLDEHNANVRRYQVEYFRERRTGRTGSKGSRGANGSGG